MTSNSRETEHSEDIAAIMRLIEIANRTSDQELADLMVARVVRQFGTASICDSTFIQIIGLRPISGTQQEE